MKPKTPAVQGPEPAASAPAVKTSQPVKRERPAAVVAAEAALAAAKAKAKAERVSAAKPKAEPRPVCTALKHGGEPCTAKAKAGQVTCVDHTPAWDRLSTGERVQWVEFVQATSAASWASELGWHRVKALLGVGA